MNLKIWLLSSLKYLVSRPRTYEILIATSLAALGMTSLSLFYTFHQPIASPVYYTIDSTGHLIPAATIQANDWLSQSQPSVLGQEIER